MNGQRQSLAMPASFRWSPLRKSIDPQAFSCGQVGPYRLGPQLRWGSFGPVHLALGKDFEVVLEIERIAVPVGDRWGLIAEGALSAQVLERMNHCVGCMHPHVAPVIGAGLEDEEPYILRPHTLSRTLGELEVDGMFPPEPVATGILYAVAEGLQCLDEFGPQPGVCLPGGIDGHQILLGWDGSVRVLGAGFALLRDERWGADLRALVSLAQRLAPSLVHLIDEARSLAEVVQRIRRERRSACAKRQQSVGRWMRQVDGDSCDALRRLFCLEPLQ